MFSVSEHRVLVIGSSVSSQNTVRTTWHEDKWCSVVSVWASPNENKSSLMWNCFYFESLFRIVDAISISLVLYYLDSNPCFVFAAPCVTWLYVEVLFVNVKWIFSLPFTKTQRNPNEKHDVDSLKVMMNQLSAAQVVCSWSAHLSTVGCRDCDAAKDELRFD